MADTQAAFNDRRPSLTGAARLVIGYVDRATGIEGQSIPHLEANAAVNVWSTMIGYPGDPERALELARTHLLAVDKGFEPPMEVSR